MIFTAPNVDLEADTIRTEINNFVKKNSNSFFFDSLGSTVYLSLMRYSLCVIGNSSSGIIEAPLLGAKSVNIGARQSGRVMAKTIFSSSFNSLDIFNSINRALSDKSRQNLQKLSTKDSPSSKIINVIKEIPLPLKNYKKFYDIK